MLILLSPFLKFGEQAEFQNLMVKDYNIGVIIRDEIIPRAVLWFIVKGADELTENDFSDFDEADDVDVDVDDDDDDGDDDVGDDDDDDDNDYDDDFDYGLPTDITKKSRKGAARKRTARK
ncbi:OLC1v1037776C1 [Oldenlandia corymbosa var. corymbosa]|uniref:OLC1v1037776C1 n=1 Tax=Oldenlandia corymbosa var. corymbosa TaxID=529605 RepID=A0AAV1CZQ9_OLDCO|nr:OLC1v1037776C1 [Oldenlandia corymbosa var. corymbosa]